MIMAMIMRMIMRMRMTMTMRMTMRMIMTMRMTITIKNKNIQFHALKLQINKKRFFYQLDKLIYKNELLLV